MFSNWLRLCRAQAFVLRLLLNSKQTGVLSPSELTRAEHEVIREAQKVFELEKIALRSNKILEKNSPLYSLSPYLDDKGVIRMRGRTANASCIGFDAKNPIILPSKSRITSLILHYFHCQFFHRNYETALNAIRQKYWVLGLRRAMRVVRSNCCKCKIMNAKPVPPQMGDIPASRLADNVPAFTNIGLDYFGPLEVTVGRRVEKRYGAIFTCFSTRAVQLELANGLTTDSCIVVLRNFIHRRGIP